MAIFYPRKTTVTLTDAQIKTLPTTPVTTIAAPGSGYRIKLFGTTMFAAFAAGAYTNVNGTSTVQLETGTADWLISPLVNDGALVDLNSFFSGNDHVFDLAVPTFFPATPSGWTQYVVGTGIAAVNNSVVRIAMDNSGSGVLTGGNAANTLKIVNYYTIESVAP